MKEKLGDPKASRKSYWSILNSFLNNAKKKKIFRSCLSSNIFISDFTVKAKLFNSYFVYKCTPIDISSKLKSFKFF